MAKRSKYENDPFLLNLVERIRSGEISRKQAADLAGLSYEMFLNRLTRAKMQPLLVDAPSNAHFQPLDPTSPKALAYEKAVQRALELHNAKRAFDEVNTPELNLNYQILCARVRKAIGKESKKAKPKVEKPESTKERKVIYRLKP